MKRIFVISALILVFVCAVLLYPGTIPNTVHTTAMIVPIREFCVTREQNGMLSWTLYNHLNGTIETSSSAEFERGDPVKFTLHRAVVPHAYIAADDTLGWIDSSSIRLELTRIGAALKTQHASLMLARSGEKTSIVEEMERNVSLAKERYEEQRKIVERLQKLQENRFIPVQDYEIAVSTLKLYEIGVDIAEAQLQNVRTGAKQQEIDMISSQIDGLEHEITEMNKKLESFTIVSPLEGIVLNAYSDSVLVHIGDTSRYVILFPVRLADKARIGNGGRVRCSAEGLRPPVTGIVIDVSNVASVINGEQVVVARALVETAPQEMVPGTTAACTVDGEPFTLKEFFQKTFSPLFGL